MRVCHDLSEGGLAVAVAEMAFAGGIGADLTRLGDAQLPDEVLLFSESTTRFVVEVRRRTGRRCCDIVSADMPVITDRPDVQGAAPAHRGLERRMDRLGGAGRAQGRLAEADALGDSECSLNPRPAEMSARRQRVHQG